ncbi:MAG: UPF0158 family protein [Myxococcota bacterium]
MLSLETGEILKLPPGDQNFAVVHANPTAYAEIEAIPSRIQYQWLDEFIKTIDDEPIRARMEAAINGKGAFRRFKDILLTLPDERRRWFEFRDIMMRTRIIEWVTEQGIEPTNEPEWEASPESLPLPTQVNITEHVEALRDFLVEWSENHESAKGLSPILLEQLAYSIGERFRLKPRQKAE